MLLSNCRAFGGTFSVLQTTYSISCRIYFVSLLRVVELIAGHKDRQRRSINLNQVESCRSLERCGDYYKCFRSSIQNHFELLYLTEELFVELMRKGLLGARFGL